MRDRENRVSEKHLWDHRTRVSERRLRSRRTRVSEKRLPDRGTKASMRHWSGLNPPLCRHSSPRSALGAGVAITFKVSISSYDDNHEHNDINFYFFPQLSSRLPWWGELSLRHCAKYAHLCGGCARMFGLSFHPSPEDASARLRPPPQLILGPKPLTCLG